MPTAVTDPQAQGIIKSHVVKNPSTFIKNSLAFKDYTDITDLKLSKKQHEKLKVIKKSVKAKVSTKFNLNVKPTTNTYDTSIDTIPPTHSTEDLKSKKEDPLKRTVNRFFKLREQQSIKCKGDKVQNKGEKINAEPKVNKKSRSPSQVRRRSSIEVSNPTSEEKRSINSLLGGREEIDILIKLRQISRKAYTLEVGQNKNCNYSIKA